MNHDDEEWQTSVVQSDFTFESSVVSLNTKAKTLHIGTGFQEQTRVSLTRKERENHTHIIGSTGTGKSKALEHFIRQDMLDRKCGLCLIDPHGPLYEELVLWISHNHPRLADRVILFNPAKETENILGFNPVPQNADPVDYALGMLISACLKCWGQDSTSQTPRIRRWLSYIFYVILKKNLTLIDTLPFMDVHSAQGNTERLRLLSGIDNANVVNAWLEFNKSSQTQKQNLIEGAANRLEKFVENGIIRNIISQTERTLDFYQLMSEGKILLVNLDGKDKISFENAQLLGVMMVNEMFRCAKLRDPRDPNVKPFYLYIDEFGQFITRDIARALEECRKYKLFLTLAHQHLAQLKKEDEYLYASVLTNCKNKIVFGGLSVEDAKIMDAEIHTGFLDLKRIKDEMYSTKERHIEETRTVQGTSKSNTEGTSESETDTESQSVTDTQGRATTEGQSTTDTEGESDTTGQSQVSGTTSTRGKTKGESDGYSDTAGESDSHTKGRQNTASKNWQHSDTSGQSDSRNESESQGQSSQKTSSDSTGTSRGETNQSSAGRTHNESRTTFDGTERGSKTDGGGENQIQSSGKNYNQSQQRTEGQSEGESSSKTTGRAHTDTRSHTDGYGGGESWGTTESDTKAKNRAHSDSHSDTFSESESASESEQHGTNEAHSKTRSRAMSEQKSETLNQSQSHTKGDSHGTTRGTNQSKTKGTSESVVPFHRVEEFLELTKREFWTKDDLHYMSTSEIKNQDTGQAFIKIGAKPPIKTKIDYVRPTYYNARTSPKRIDDFRMKVFEHHAQFYTPLEQTRREFEARQQAALGDPLKQPQKQLPGQTIDVKPEPEPKKKASPLPEHDE